MHLPDYNLEELAFAFRCYVYFRWHTFYRQSIAELKRLTPEALQAIHPEIHVLELNATETEMGLLVSLPPCESISVVASKLKGAASKTIRELQGHSAPAKTLGGGYFAATTGGNTTPELENYLAHQESHHGYDHRANSPVLTRTWDLSDADRGALQTAHAVTLLNWHVVLATWNRQGVFTRKAAEEVCECWKRHSPNWRIRLRKATVLPDHVHIAMWSHPTAAPGRVALDLMATSQDLMRERFEPLVVQAGIYRLWKPGAYVGSYGDIAKDRVRNYLRRWEDVAR
jgi:REP element-mobilizing transposase RayT